ncbi:30S ribosomal protein S9 [candidate division WWE3 bacterium]|uniref:Small ribosomal subunit protein uS9 n=1 Tax=candidate division WWE3 bacterium TaxID=2053526 RepID=A0A955LLJ5_UNCKA|nr:30S ribosomal protein S9 [candidate division WWE3 bacterium]
MVEETKKKAKNTDVIWISGRRKTSVARIRLQKGKGEFVFDDDKKFEEVFPLALDRDEILRPFKVTGRDPKSFSVSVKLAGGGKKGQLEATRLGIAKALVEMEDNLRPLLKDAGLLTRDPRMKERKKYGLKRARKAPQFSKR